MPAAKIVKVANKDQAQAMSNFLWNEKLRHERDILRIIQDLGELWKVWKVRPDEVEVFVEP